MDALALRLLFQATLAALGLCLAIAIAAVIHSDTQVRPVVRIPLNQVPIEKVVEFGHADGTFAIALPDKMKGIEEIGSVEHAKNSPDRPENRQRPLAYVEPDRNGVLPISFSLDRGSSSGAGGVGVTKTIATLQGQMTGLTIFLVGGSSIEVDRAELAQALTAIGAGERSSSLPAAGSNGRLSLDRVRQAGLGLRYDAIRDRLVLDH